MSLGPTEKARKYINEVDGIFCMQQVADAIGCTREKISNVATSLKTDKCIEFVESKPLTKGGFPHKFFKRIKKSDVIQKGTARRQETHTIDTSDPWNKFCFNRLA